MTPPSKYQDCPLQFCSASCAFKIKKKVHWRTISNSKYIIVTTTEILQAAAVISKGV